MILCSYSIFLLQLSSMKSRKYVYFIKFNGFWSYKICCVKISISQMSDTKALFLCKLFTFYAVIYFYFTTLIQRTLQSATRHQISFKNMRSILSLFQLQKRLYNHRCLFICLSFCVEEKLLFILHPSSFIHISSHIYVSSDPFVSELGLLR